MAEDVKRLDEKIDRLESKLKATFLEVDRRFEDVKTLPIAIEDRLQELEDLILLMQLEITKIKDKTSVTTDFITPQTPDFSERITRVEEALGIKAIQEAPPPEPEEKHEELDLHSEEIEVTDKEEQPTPSLVEKVQKILSE